MGPIGYLYRLMLVPRAVLHCISMKHRVPTDHMMLIHGWMVKACGPSAYVPGLRLNSFPLAVGS